MTLQSAGRSARPACEQNSESWADPRPVSPLRVLIVDDNDINRRTLKGTLQSEGIHVVEASDGRHALEVMNREEVDAVISDLLMPNVTGYQLCCEVRKDPRFKAMPFIIYTANSTGPRDRHLAQELGVDRFIQRPAPPLELLTALAELLVKHRNSPQRTEMPGEFAVSKNYSEWLIGRLEESEARFRGIFENIRDVFFAIDTEFTIQMVSPSIRRYGYDPEALVGTSLRNILFRTPAERDRFKHSLLVAKVVEDFEVELKSTNGGPVVMSLNARLIFDEKGHVRGIEGLLRDITERTRAAEILRRREERFRALLENSQSAVALLSRDGRIEYLSHSLLGYRAEELTGRSGFDFVNPEDGGRIAAVFGECVRNPGVPMTAEYRTRDKDGVLRYMEVVALNRLEDPAVEAIIVNYHDITRLREAELERDRLLSERKQPSETPR